MGHACRSSPDEIGLLNPLGCCLSYADRRVGLLQHHEAGNRITEGHKVLARETATFSLSYMSDTRKAVVLFSSNDSERKDSRVS
jgi:hypothetical protein